MSEKKAAAQPQVGIFWVYQGNIIQFSEFADLSKAVGGFVDSPYDHVNMWKQVVAQHPELKGQPYESVPRGRVSLTPQGFNLLCNQKIAANKILVAQIMRRFSLPPAKTRVQTDEHYENPESVVDAHEEGAITQIDQKLAKLLRGKKF